MKAPVVIVALALGLSACANMNSPEPRRVEASPELRTAQYRLHALGFYNGAPDGLWGPETAGAVQRFQASRHLADSGRLDHATYAELRDETRPVPVALNRGDDVRKVQDRLTQLGFYSGKINGDWTPETQAALERFQRDRGLEVGPPTRVSLAAMDLNPYAFARADTSPSFATTSSGGTASPLQPRVVKGVQERLRELGFYKGSADGIWGSGTRTALQDFQHSRGMEPTGDLTPATASMLGFDPNNLSDSAVADR